MKKTKMLSVALSTLFTAAAILPATACTDGIKNGANFFPTVTIAQADGGVSYTIDGAWKDGVTLPLLSGDIYTVCAEYKKYVTDQYNASGKDCYAPTPVTLSWECDEEPLYATLELSTNKDMSDADYYVTFDDSVTLNYLYMGYDYYYRIHATYEDKIVKSRVFEFSTEYLPRTIHVDDKVSNTRDWGGYLVGNGEKRVKQGIVYRGGALEDITEAGRAVMLQDLGIKTDLDVRGDGSTNTKKSPLGANINYVETKGPYYVYSSTGIEIEREGEYRDALLTEIRTFANKDNFPIYVHCSLGRDRTGTICFLINALLGVSETDLYRDYELSMMSRTGKLDGNNAAYMVGSAFSNLYNYIAGLLPGQPLSKCTEYYMRTIGITAAEITAIKENMLEEVK